MANREDVILLAVGDIKMHTFPETKSAVGDVKPHLDPESKLALCAPILRQGDIVFGHHQQVLSDTVNPDYYWGVVEKEGDRVAKALANAGFNVMSAASNVHMSAGPGALLENINFLKRNNILPIGVGKNLAEARTPVIIERKGVRVAFLGYSSVIPKGGEVAWEARDDKPGCAPMFINTFYDQIDYQPGTPPRVITFAEKPNLKDMEEDIRKAKAQADVVVMSMHWGVHHIPAVIAMYEYEVGHAAVDAGVDLILGHHAHFLKGIEIYKGKVIFHCLGNFSSQTYTKRGVRGYWEDMRPPQVQLREFGWSKSPVAPSSSSMYHSGLTAREVNLSMIAKCIISGKKIERVSFQPCMINDERQPEPLFRNDKRSDEVYEYMDWACKETGMDTRFSREGDEVVIHTDRDSQPPSSSLIMDRHSVS